MQEPQASTGAEQKQTGSGQHTNDFTIHVATVNGSGSQSANNTLLRAIFYMGIPVSGKNLFPSNIQGMPTWFTIRVNKDGYIARSENIDILVAVNAETAHEDVQAVRPGGLVIYDEPLKLDTLRDDLTFYPVPFKKLVTPIVPVAKLRKMVSNIIYVGVLAQLLGIDMQEVEKALHKQFKGKLKAVELNMNAAKVGFDYAQENFQQQKTFTLERMDKTAGKIIIDGNSAGALGSMFAGVSVVTWYPITPSTSVVEKLMHYMQKYRVDAKTGKSTYAILQAEDELAAIGMVIGAGWAGARAMTATSGPGISLMTEFIGLAYFAEVPAVLFDVQRVGPSTGMPTRTQQGDILACATLSHGDTRHILLLPCSPEEVFEMAGDAFDLAEQFQTPVFVMSDLDLGMNNWMADKFSYPDKPLNRGKVLSAEELEKFEDFGRYKDEDGDGIPYRTLPGTKHPKAPYFTRGSGHNIYAHYTEDPEEYSVIMQRLAKKLETARTAVPAPVIEEDENAQIGIIAYGTTHWAVQEMRDRLRAKGTPTSYLRLRAYPFSDEVKAFIARHERVYVIEQNRDGQMLALMRMEYPAEVIARLRSLTVYDGLPVSADTLTRKLEHMEQE